MARRVAIGSQDFAFIREGGFFYVDKTGFVRDWWDSGDSVTLVCRPRRFGKTLALSTVECFFSTRYAGRGEELFGGLEVWGDAGAYATALVERGIARERIHSYGIAFSGKHVLVG